MFKMYYFFGSKAFFSFFVLKGVGGLIDVVWFDSQEHTCACDSV